MTNQFQIPQKSNRKKKIEYESETFNFGAYKKPNTCNRYTLERIAA